MKFKINNCIISAKSLKDAVKIYSCIKKLKDEDSDVEFLSEEERQAIEDYKKAISNTNDPKLLRLFSHILKEEIEHLEELQSEEVEDAVIDKPDADTNSGRQELALQMIMEALAVIPAHKWNRSGYKVNIDNNRITLVCSTDGSVLWKNYEQSDKDMKFTNALALKNRLREEHL